jgi:hypothetical protein
MRFTIMNQPEPGDTIEKGYQGMAKSKRLPWTDRQWQVVSTHLAAMKIFYAAYEETKLDIFESLTVSTALLKLPDELFAQPHATLLLALDRL